MNIQEREQLDLFLQQLTQVQADRKDAEADALIRDACARQPDAGYLLVQRAMQLEHLLQATNARCAQLQAELDSVRSSTQGSFINDINAWGRTPVSSAVPSAPASVYPATNMPPRAQAPLATPAAGGASSWGTGILGNVATTAAGVVAGSFLFHGLQNLMGHHNEQSGLGATHPDARAAQPLADNTAIDNDYHNTGLLGDPDEMVDAGGESGGSDSA